MAILRFQQLPLTAFDSAYSIVTTSVEWLHHRNLPSWLIPRAVYYERHVSGDNYGLFVDNILYAVVTLTTYHPNDWGQSIAHKDFTWLATLASTRTQPACQYGKTLMQFAEQHTIAQHVPAIYLDCYYGDGKLPRYYQQLGYEWLGWKKLVFEDGSIHDSVLMRKVFVTT